MSDFLLLNIMEWLKNYLLGLPKCVMRLNWIIGPHTQEIFLLRKLSLQRTQLPHQISSNPQKTHNLLHCLWATCQVFQWPSCWADMSWGGDSIWIASPSSFIRKQLEEGNWVQCVLMELKPGWRELVSIFCSWGPVFLEVIFMGTERGNCPVGSGPMREDA